jgi:hypothetical protein
VSSLLADAQQIFEVASQSGEPEDITIRISPEGGIFISAGSDYSPSRGITYRVRRAQGRVTVEGQSGSTKCMLESGGYKPLFVDRPAYLLAGAAC